MGETVHQNFWEALRHRWALPAMPPFHASQGTKGTEGLVQRAAWAPGAQQTPTPPTLLDLTCTQFTACPWGPVGSTRVRVPA